MCISWEISPYLLQEGAEQCYPLTPGHAGRELRGSYPDPAVRGLDTVVFAVMMAAVCSIRALLNNWLLSAPPEEDRERFFDFFPKQHLFSGFE